MKVNKFNENTEMELIDKIDMKEYIVEMYDKNREHVFNGKNLNIERATELYYNLKKKYNNRYIFLVEKSLRVLKDEEIEILNTANKYNL